MNDESVRKPDAVTLISEDGEKEIFLHILTFRYEGDKYAALVPEEQADAEEPELLFVRVIRDKKGDAYIPVENEVLLEELFTEFDSLLSETDDACEAGGEDGGGANRTGESGAAVNIRNEE